MTAPGPGLADERTNRESAERPGFPLEARALAAFLVFDLIGGIWLALHYPPGMSLFLSQVPVVGIAGAVWGFLPDPQKDMLGRWLAGVLRLRAVFSFMVLILGGLAALTFVLATVRVDAVESDVATMLWLVPGSQREVDQGHRTVLDSARLNRLTTPHFFFVFLSPTGRRVWLHSSTHITARDLRIRPWLPNRLQYPDDFTPMTAIAVLPSPQSFPVLASHQSVTLVLRDLYRDDTLGIATIKADLRGQMVTFTEPGPPTADVRQRWRQLLTEIFGDDPADSSNINGALGFWDKAKWVRSRRPFVPDDSVRWDIRTTKGDSLAAGRLGLNHGITDLVLVL